MPLIVQKYGGSSVADAKSVKRVAQRIAETKKAGNDVVVVVSAMGDTTDDLLDLSAQVSDNPPSRELDILLTAGERISMALLAMAINQLGIVAKSFTGQQAGVLTDAVYGKAHIVDVVPDRIRESLTDGEVAIVAGFQGVNPAMNDATTLGRGGSDTTAVAIAAGLDADVCEIFTDVDGVFTADPRIVASARKVENITYEEMLELAANGAKVLAVRSVEYARRHNVPIHVRSSFTSANGTFITAHARIPGSPDPIDGEIVEAPIISGVAHDRSEAKITIEGVPDTLGRAALIFETVADAETNIDMIVQNAPIGDHNVTDISFTLPQDDLTKTVAALEAKRDEIGYAALHYDDKIGKLSLIGAGMKSNPGVTAKLFGALRDAGINIEMITTSEIRISVVTRVNQLNDAVKAIHSAFDLDSHDGQAQVYAGTGR